MKKVILIYGTIAGVIVGGLMLIFWPLMESEAINMDNGMLLGYATMILALSLIFFAVKTYRDKHNKGNISFGKAVMIGLLITLVAGVLYAFAWEIMFSQMGEQYMQKMMQHYQDSKVPADATPEQIEAVKLEIEDFIVMYKNPFIRFGITIMEVLPVGLVISLISAALLRKKEV